MTSKICTKCSETKNVSEFSLRKDRPCGYTSSCKSCASAHKRASRKMYPERYLLTSAKRRAKLFNRVFDLKEEDIVIPDCCPILGIPLVIDGGVVKQHSPTLDRIDNSKGYIKGNIQVISMRANTMKGDRTMEALTEYIKGNYTHKLWIPIKPAPAARPRISKYGNYYPKPYTEFRKEIYRFFKTVQHLYKAKDKVKVKIKLEIVAKKPKKPTNEYPRGDIDNFCKSYLDSVTYAQLIYCDDIQVTEIEATKRYQWEGEDYGAFLYWSYI